MLIPFEVYALVESKLRKRHQLVARAEIRMMQGQADAQGMLLAKGGSQAAPGGKRRHRKSRAEQAAALIADAESALENARAWEGVFRLLDKTFPYPGSPEGETAHLLYEQGMSQEDARKILHCDRQTVRRRRDAYITHGGALCRRGGFNCVQKGGRTWRRITRKTRCCW